ncbi:hypothetical protein HY408_00755 [Candidatus Gottesmanbacteria bacterium]|nr:hypothetical protein [Candidatus Gottesmanbacteria bacterium]
MHEIGFRSFRIYSAEDLIMHREPTFNHSWTNRRTEFLVYMFTKRKLFREMLDVWQSAIGVTGYAILAAHGDFDGQWVYYENDFRMGTVQEWVDKMDGSVAALMVTCCNPEECEIVSRKSLVLHPGRLARSFPEMVHTPGLIRLFVPPIGYVENDYKRLRRIINQLKKDDFIRGVL